MEYTNNETAELRCSAVITTDLMDRKSRRACIHSKQVINCRVDKLQYSAVNKRQKLIDRQSRRAYTYSMQYMNRRIDLANSIASLAGYGIRWLK